MTGSSSDETAGRCPDCGTTAPYWHPDDRECEVCLALAEMPDCLDEIAIDAEADCPNDIRAHLSRLRQIHGLLAEHIRVLLGESSKWRAKAEALTDEVDRLGTASVEICESWRKKAEQIAAEAEQHYRLADIERGRFNIMRGTNVRLRYEIGQLRTWLSELGYDALVVDARLQPTAEQQRQDSEEGTT